MKAKGKARMRSSDEVCRAMTMAAPAILNQRKYELVTTDEQIMGLS